MNRYEDVAPFLQAVNAASDAHRDFLGFIRRGAFEALARGNDLFVLTIQNGASLEYAGHLLFARRYPKAQVLQLFVAPEYRGQKFGRLLCDRLIELLTRDGFTSIYARVGEDMRDANEAWEHMGFQVQRVEAGGVTTGRTIVVRVKELESPQLFPTHSVDQADPLGLTRSLSTETPLFLIDLNVLFDLSPHRGRHEEAITLFQAERANFCRLAISDEIITELARTGPAGRPDPMMNLARTFTRFPVSDANLESAIVQELAKLVFPHKAVRSLSKNDVSDLRHLITAIENKLAGLVTNDEASLRVAREIEKRFGVQVLSPKAFLPDESAVADIAAYETANAGLELLRATDSDDADIRSLLSRLGTTPADLTSGWSGRASTSFVVRSGSNLVACMSWPALKPENIATIRAAVDETTPDATAVSRGVITHCMNLNIDGPTTLRLMTPPNQVLLRDIARGVGFYGTQDTSDLIKLAFGRVATKGNWHRRRAELAEMSGFKMDGQFPLYRRMEQQIAYFTRSGPGYQTLERFETLLSPTLFCLPGRPAVITPIKHKFAKLLLGHSKQVTFLPAPNSICSRSGISSAARMHSAN